MCPVRAPCSAHVVLFLNTSLHWLHLANFGPFLEKAVIVISVLSSGRSHDLVDRKIKRNSKRLS